MWLLTQVGFKVTPPPPPPPPPPPHTHTHHTLHPTPWTKWPFPHTTFSWMKMKSFVFQFEFHFSLKFVFKVQLTITQHWLREWFGAEQCWPSSPTHVCGTRGRWAKPFLVRLMNSWIQNPGLVKSRFAIFTYTVLICLDLKLMADIMMASLNGNIFRVTGPLCGEFIGHRWIPRTKASDAELWCFLWSAPE